MKWEEIFKEQNQKFEIDLKKFEVNFNNYHKLKEKHSKKIFEEFVDAAVDVTDESIRNQFELVITRENFNLKTILEANTQQYTNLKNGIITNIDSLIKRTPPKQQDQFNAKVKNSVQRMYDLIMKPRLFPSEDLNLKYQLFFNYINILSEIKKYKKRDPNFTEKLHCQKNDLANLLAEITEAAHKITKEFMAIENLFGAYARVALTEIFGLLSAEKKAEIEPAKQKTLDCLQKFTNFIETYKSKVAQWNAGYEKLIATAPVSDVEDPIIQLSVSEKKENDIPIEAKNYDSKAIEKGQFGKIFKELSKNLPPQQTVSSAEKQEEIVDPIKAILALDPNFH